jgi:hypothetical protein
LFVTQQLGPLLRWLGSVAVALIGLPLAAVSAPAWLLLIVAVILAAAFFVAGAIVRDSQLSAEYGLPTSSSKEKVRIGGRVQVGPVAFTVNGTPYGDSVSLSSEGPFCANCLGPVEVRGGFGIATGTKSVGEVRCLNRVCGRQSPSDGDQYELRANAEAAVQARWNQAIREGKAPYIDPLVDLS